METNDINYIESGRLVLRPLIESDFSLEYFRWLNDPVVNEFSQRRPFPAYFEDIRSYYEYYRKNPKEGFVLGIIAKKEKIHIGNIALVNLQPIHRCGEITILIGKRQYWNKGYGGEAIYALTKHAFLYHNLHRVFAGTFNPSFAKCVEKLGWKKEGEFRDRIWSDGRYRNQLWYGILREEFEESENR